nr:modular serine protease-like [Danaus plexippus plexippus]
MACNGLSDPLSDLMIRRPKRQTQNCRKNQWQCRDGTCIGFDGKCDGVVDCPDFSDETFALCRDMQCQSNWFRCTYGACVDGSAPCNGVQECADNSDELLPRCRNQTIGSRGKHTCDNGQVISSVDICDGKKDCADGSDETLATCAGNSCPSYVFQCAYGACVDQNAKCNKVEECADGSDETDELCNRLAPGQPVTPATRPPPQGGNCLLPPYPQYGSYKVRQYPNAVPGQRYPNVRLDVTCNPGFQTENNNSIFCDNGEWSGPMPACLRFCRLNKHPSVEYRCLLSGNSVTGSRECGSLEPSGTVVTPICRSPNYYSSGVMSNMHCVEGSWDYIAVCKPECGTITPEGIQLVIGGRSAKRGELPWHAGIYSKLFTPYMQICGGSLISTTTIISDSREFYSFTAHCFWSDTKKLLPASEYAVAVGKLYRPYNEKHDADAEKSDVADIIIPSRFRGSGANFQDDIALVLVVTPFIYQVFIRPVCLDFDVNFDRTQLSEGNMGKVAGWGLTDKNGKASQVLKVVDLPYVKIEDCYAMSPPTFRAYITSDKICAGYTNGTTLCQGDSGGGLAFPAYELNTQRYYLRGIVSTAPRNDDLCNAHTLTTFTAVSKHEHFIKQYL